MATEKHSQLANLFAELFDEEPSDRKVAEAAAKYNASVSRLQAERKTTAIVSEEGARDLFRKRVPPAWSYGAASSKSQSKVRIVSEMVEVVDGVFVKDVKVLQRTSKHERFVSKLNKPDKRPDFEIA
jgi:hypothetical protein